jgi:hypothetical protein
MFSSIEYIRKYYNVPAKVGGWVKYKGKEGRITGAAGAYLKIKLDGEKKSFCYHPTFEIEYLTEENK